MPTRDTREYVYYSPLREKLYVVDSYAHTLGFTLCIDVKDYDGYSVLFSHNMVYLGVL